MTQVESEMGQWSGCLLLLYHGCWCTSEKNEVSGYAIQEGCTNGTGQVVPLVVKVALPVLELSCHSFGDTSTHQANQEQYTDAPTDHRENVVL